MVNIEVPIFPQRLQALVTEPLPQLVRRVIQAARDITEEEALENPEKATGFAFEYDGEQTEENLPKLPVEETIFTYLKPTRSEQLRLVRPTNLLDTIRLQLQKVCQPC